MRLVTLIAMLLASFIALGADYMLDPGASVRNGTLTVEPVVKGPPGAVVEYEVRTVREGQGGRSNSSQSGEVELGRDGEATLASTSVNVSPRDRYSIHVKVMEGSRVVAEKRVRYPD